MPAGVGRINQRIRMSRAERALWADFSRYGYKDTDGRLKYGGRAVRARESFFEGAAAWHSSDGSRRKRNWTIFAD